MLILTASTASINGARRGYPMRRCREHLDEVRFGEILVITVDPNANALSWKRERNHHNPARTRFDRNGCGCCGRWFYPGCVWQGDTTKSQTEIGQRRDFQFYLLVILERMVVEFLFMFPHVAHEIH